MVAASMKGQISLYHGRISPIKCWDNYLSSFLTRAALTKTMFELEDLEQSLMFYSVSALLGRSATMI